ncbi:hypothetical protein HYH02_005990 [Chlamydomonas schloesseri]|uniref:Uncharacterized protein n=1 Tax=Chlamydomonas schloesseri TaxID=2026947 RepID=A0A836B741_9CHLO|nr:hypothetical protein HYH02_005990 [Chlamydomonas schloesseri]|eukprot:KAG2449244.1 hypothetical protein HYH02_005990 [Chlamydomonas schloesseri]
MHHQEAKFKTRDSPGTASAERSAPRAEYVIHSPPRLSLALEKARYSDSSKAPTSGRTVVQRGAASMDRATPAGPNPAAAAQALRRRANTLGAGPAVAGVAASGSRKDLDAAAAVARVSNVGDCEHLSGSLYDTQETMDSATVQEILGSVDAHHVHDTKLLLSACNWDMDELLMREMGTYLN